MYAMACLQACLHACLHACYEHARWWIVPFDVSTLIFKWKNSKNQSSGLLLSHYSCWADSAPPRSSHGIQTPPQVGLKGHHGSHIQSLNGIGPKIIPTWGGLWIPWEERGGGIRPTTITALQEARWLIFCIFSLEYTRWHIKWYFSPPSMFIGMHGGLHEGMERHTYKCSIFSNLLYSK